MHADKRVNNAKIASSEDAANMPVFDDAVGDIDSYVAQCKRIADCSVESHWLAIDHLARILPERLPKQDVGRWLKPLRFCKSLTIGQVIRALLPEAA